MLPQQCLARGSSALDIRTAVDVPQSRQILKGVPDDEQVKPAPDHDPGIACGNIARVYNFDVTKLTAAA